MFKEKISDKKCSLIYILLMACVSVVFIFCSRADKYTEMLFTVWVMWIINVVWGCMCFKERLLYLMFHVSYATFFMFRPLIEVFRNYDWWNKLGYAFDEPDMKFALTLLFVGLCGLGMGGVLGIVLCRRKRKTFQVQFKYNKNKNNKAKEQFVRYLGVASLLLTIVSALAYVYSNTYQFIWALNNGGYTASYTSSGVDMPYPIYILSVIHKYSIMVYLTTLPNKKKAYGVLGLYAVAEIPKLLMGNRSGFALRLIFALLYFCIREFSDGKKTWLGKFERISIAVAVPLGTVFFGVYNYIRDGLSFWSLNIFAIIVDFFYKQGVSFCTLCLAHKIMPSLLAEKYVNFTFGEIIDYWAHGTIAQKFFHASSLPDVNSVEMATVSNNLGHRISYLINRVRYLRGHGYGSSYLLEGYVDWGFVGAIVLSIVLGVVLVSFFYWLGKNRLLDVMLLYMLTSLFFVPRAEFMMPLSFLTQLQFWMSIIMCYAGAKILMWFCRMFKISWFTDK